MRLEMKNVFHIEAGWSRHFSPRSLFKWFDGFSVWRCMCVCVLWFVIRMAASEEGTTSEMEVH